MEKFINISYELGKNILNVQGPGGNSSMKRGNKLIIKASGFKMSGKNKNSNYSVCNHKTLSGYIDSKKRYSKNDEEEFIELIEKSLVKDSPNPSMEIGFHAVIPSKYVFHLHSVYANIFLCMEGGSGILRKIFKDVHNTFIDYKNPGYELSLYLSKLKKYPKLIFLKNHGIIIHSNDLNECLKLSDLINERIENYLKKEGIYELFVLSKEVKIGKKFLFPDAAVFSTLDVLNSNLRKKKDVLEILSAQEYIFRNIEKFKRKPVYLNDREVKRLLNMKQEKHRQKLPK